MNHEYFMRRALHLAARGRHASPNPMVGCVIVNSAAEIVGEGFHPQAGEPHAEIFALRSALPELLGGVTAYVTLEPCSHHGRTPPCAIALRDAGIKQVIAAMADPDPRVAGRGFELLREGGVDVVVGVLEREARALNAAYLKHRTSGRPWVTLKTAMTLDGKIAATGGDSRWISSPVSRRAVHRQLRDRCDALLTGVGTILRDDPSLTTRLVHRVGRDPLRIVVDTHCRTPLHAEVVRQAAVDGKTLVATVQSADNERYEALAAQGCRLMTCAADSRGRVSLPDLLQQLGTRGDVIGVLVESGGELAASLIAEKLVDRWLAWVAPKIVGGHDAPGPIGGAGMLKMADAQEVSIRRMRRCGPDYVFDVSIG